MSVPSVMKCYVYNFRPSVQLSVISRLGIRLRPGGGEVLPEKLGREVTIISSYMFPHIHTIITLTNTSLHFFKLGLYLYWLYCTWHAGLTWTILLSCGCYLLLISLVFIFNCFSQNFFNQQREIVFALLRHLRSRWYFELCSIAINI